MRFLVVVSVQSRGDAKENDDGDGNKHETQDTTTEANKQSQEDTTTSHNNNQHQQR